MKDIKALMNKRSGFTLLEVMVSLAILTIILISLFKLHSQTLSLNSSVKFYSIAPFLAQKKMSEILISQDLENIHDYGDFEDQFTGYRWEISGESIVSDYFEDDILKEINVIISFDKDFIYELNLIFLHKQK